MRALLTPARAWRERRIRERIQRMQDRTQREREEPAPPDVRKDPLFQLFCVDGLPPVDRKAVPNRRHRKVSAA